MKWWPLCALLACSGAGREPAPLPKPSGQPTSAPAPAPKVPPTAWQKSCLGHLEAARAKAAGVDPELGTAFVEHEPAADGIEEVSFSAAPPVHKVPAVYLQIMRGEEPGPNDSPEWQRQDEPFGESNHVFSFRSPATGKATISLEGWSGAANGWDHGKEEALVAILQAAADACLAP